MSTTQLFAELAIIGLGASIWLFFLVAAVLGMPIENSLFKVSPISLPSFIGIIYVFGIILDRICYSLFSKLNRRVSLHEPEKPPLEDRERFILEKSDTLKLQINYDRSRSRICRAWVLNFSMISVSFFVWNLKIGFFPIIKATFLSLVLFFLASCSYYVWLKLSCDHQNNIKFSYDYLYSREISKCIDGKGSSNARLVNELAQKNAQVDKINIGK